jgi:thiol-disulfide isomerase/thioredoxin
MSVLLRSWKLALVAGLMGAIAFGTPGIGQEEPAKKSDEKTEAKDDEEEDKEEDKAAEAAKRYEVPKDADAADLIKYMEGVLAYRGFTSREEFNAHREKAAVAIREAGNKVLELEKDNKKSENYTKAQFLMIAARLHELQKDDEKVCREIVDETTAYLSAKDPEEIKGNDLALARSVAQQLEFTGKPDLAKEALTSFSGVFAKASEKNEDLKPLVESMAGTLRRMNLLGNEIEIKGKLVDGTDFDWKAYSKGKVILVDFWATWCGPCIAELPNVKKNYEKYHEKGFDVVGISLDTDRKKLEAFLEEEGTKWANLFEDDAGWKHPVAVHYGISGIPTVILVDQQGKVVSLNARGPELGKQLEKLLGSSDSTEKKDDEKGGN